MSRPAHSPDLNPIENVWWILTARVYRDGKQNASVAALQAANIREWHALDTYRHQSLLDASQVLFSRETEWRDLHILNRECTICFVWNILFVYFVVPSCQQFFVVHTGRANRIWPHDLNRQKRIWIYEKMMKKLYVKAYFTCWRAVYTLTNSRVGRHR